ncbi:MAG: sorbosone dehydrogenase family protein, partial [Saprospiraceae bacterium]|nr:sorbosone dehydrogenase family protein [Saprospiraceae bacterium]
MTRVILLFFCINLLFACSPGSDPGDTPSTDQAGGLALDEIILPPGFRISLFAEDVENARSLCRSPEGTLFVGTRNKGSIYALRDTDGDYQADERHTLIEGLNLPNGVAVRNGDLFF